MTTAYSSSSEQQSPGSSQAQQPQQPSSFDLGVISDQYNIMDSTIVNCDWDCHFQSLDLRGTLAAVAEEEKRGGGEHHCAVFPLYALTAHSALSESFILDIQRKILYSSGSSDNSLFSVDTLALEAPVLLRDIAATKFDPQSCWTLCGTFCETIAKKETKRQRLSGLSVHAQKAVTSASTASVGTPIASSPPTPIHGGYQKQYANIEFSLYTDPQTQEPLCIAGIVTADTVPVTLFEKERENSRRLQLFTEQTLHELRNCLCGIVGARESLDELTDKLQAQSQELRDKLVNWQQEVNQAAAAWSQQQSQQQQQKEQSRSRVLSPEPQLVSPHDEHAAEENNEENREKRKSPRSGGLRLQLDPSVARPALSNSSSSSSMSLSPLPPQQQTDQLLAPLSDSVSSIKELVQILQECSTHQKNILDDHLVVKRLETGKLVLRPRPFYLDDLVRSVQRMMSKYISKLAGQALSKSGGLGGGEESPTGPPPQKPPERDVQLLVEWLDENGSVLSSAQVQQLRQTALHVYADDFLLKQILLNHVTNGIKHVQHGFVKICLQILPAASLNESRILFAIKDTGCGIEPNQIPLLFNRFSQARSEDRSMGTSGLGLYISQQLLRLFDREANIQVQSTVGEGTTFSFCLSLQRCTTSQDQAESSAAASVASAASAAATSTAPQQQQPVVIKTNEVQPASVMDTIGDSRAQIKQLAERVSVSPSLSEINLDVLQMESIEPPIVLSAEGETSKSQSTSKDTVVIVDDNPLPRRILSKFAEDTDVAHIIQCTNGCEALSYFEHLDRQHYDRVIVVFMDVQMPRVDGLTATRRIRELENDRGLTMAGRHGVPIIGLTGNAEPESQQAAVQAGMDGCFSKPFVRQTFNELI